MQAAVARRINRRLDAMYAMRRRSVRQARLLDKLHGAFERVLIASDAIPAKIGYQRLEAKTHRAIGVGPLASPGVARWMRAHHPGIHIPRRMQRS